MENNSKLTCVLVGDGTLLLQCAEALLKRSHEVLGIVSNDNLIHEWARNRGIPYTEYKSDILTFLKQQPFDYLFSIVNSHLLSKEILSIPRFTAINYHDSPLPRYAGTHATSWALMNQEMTHGVTWHIMTDLVDAGDILKQAIFAIDLNDTAFMLNLKCYSAAISTFNHLIEELSSGRYVPKKQDLRERTYFLRSKRPSGGSVISWNHCARDLDALARSLDFGPYPNPLCLPKLMVDGDFIVVSKIEVLEEMSKSPPGRITDIDPTFIKVSTKTYALILRKLFTINGEKLTIPEFVSRFALHVGYQFKEIEPVVASRIGDFDALIAEKEEFWINRLTTFRPISIPYAVRLSTPPSLGRYMRAQMPVPAEVTRFLQEREPTWDWTDFVLAAFAVFLGRLSETWSFDVGFRDAELQRAVAGFEGVVASQVPCRIDIDYNQSFEQVFDSVRQQVLLTKLHKTYARDILIRYPALRSFSQLSNSQVVPVTIECLENISDVRSELPSGEFKLLIVKDKKELICAYNVDAFSEKAIEAISEQFYTIINSIIRSPSKVVSHLRMLSESEKQKIIVDWNNTKTDYPKDKCIHQLFEEQVARTPDAIAVIFEDQQLSYQALNARANQLAHYLQTVGVKPDTLVAICMERSIDLVIGLLAILKAGGAYVPLDPAYPTSRLALMLEDAFAAVLIIEKSLQSIQPNDYPGHIIVFNGQDVEAIAQQPDSNPSITVLPGQPAYMVYTSGSTGEPKGVVIPHQAIVRLIINTNYIELTATDRIAQVSNISFDAATFEIWGALLTGARLIIIQKELLLSVSEFDLTVKNQGISTLFLTTAFFNEMVNTVPGAFGSLKNLLFGGEAVTPSQVRKLLAHTPPKRLLHVYGPTETTTFATWFEINNVAEDAATIPIGRPLANTQLYVLDKHLQPVPVGITGELYIGGDGIALGYHNRPELNNERFLPNPFNQSSGRLYKTGDLVRYLPDGTIEFLGRIDHQVKLRGFRIELGEIESVLGQHPGINEVVVTVREDQPGDKRLVAYLTHSQHEPPNVNAIRLFLKEKLPEYMVPSVFVLLDKLPLTPNGKIDRKALPAPDQTRPEFEQSYVPPRSPIEEMLVAIWREVLNIDRIGIHDNFFELGGHSLLAVQMLSRVWIVFGVELDLRRMFERPTVAGLAREIEGAQPGIAQRPPIRSVPRGEELPLSFSQERFWIVSQLDPQNPVYNCPKVTRILGPLDVVVFDQCLAAVVARHEVLRANFLIRDGRPVQVIAESRPTALRVVDLAAFPVREREARADWMVREEVQCPFDLARDPLLRGLLLKFGPEEHVLILTNHHIVSDAWSVGVLNREMAALYCALCAGESSPLPPLVVQYGDFATWQRQWMQSGGLDAELAYWRKQIQGLSTLQLPTDHARPRVQTFAGARQFFTLSGRLSESLTSLSHREGVSLFMTVVAAFQTLLHRYSGQDDIAVGSPVSTRNRVETEPLIGCFLNTLVLRTDCSGAPSFRELLGRAREVTLDAHANQELPFEKLVEALNPERDLSRQPLIQVLVNMHVFPDEDLTLPGLKLMPLDYFGVGSMFDLTLFYYYTPDGCLRFTLEYSTDLFNAETIARLIGHFQTLLAAIVERPETAIAELPLLTAPERHQLLVEWNATSTDYPKDKCIHQLFEEQVARTPDAIALVFEDQQLSYQALNAKANQLAHHLRNIGVGPEVLVGICLERSLDMEVGLLGILKAGGAYLPLDPAYPKKRLAFMLEDSAPLVLLTETKTKAILTGAADYIPRVDLAADRSLWAGQSKINLNLQEIGLVPENLAYVIFTSGSTGQPKGAMNEHRGVVNRLNWMQRAYGLGQRDAVLQKTPFSFDVSVWEFFWPLFTGARLVMARPEGHKEPGYLGEVIRRENITTLHFVPPMLQVFLEHKDATSCTSLLRVICSGEALPGTLVKRFHEQLPETGLHNLYGPTEAAVDVTAWACVAGSPTASTPIGRPIDNTRIYILDPHGEPVPIGVTGELYIGGVQVGRGYLNHPELTAERFLPDPFVGEPAARMYKTGDLGRWLTDGAIEFLGRKDFQVKIRGFRIELGEIESVLGQHPGINEVVVTVREDQPGDKRLIAYLTHSQHEPPNVSVLRQFLKEKLPEYMVPVAFVLLDQFPLTPNGKIDRKALPAPDQTRPEFEPSYVPPRSPIEEMLAAIWREVLNSDRIGIHDNFFELGGHSLLAVQLIVRINKQFQMDFPLYSLFEAPTIAGLSVQLETTILKQENPNTIEPIKALQRKPYQIK